MKKAFVNEAQKLNWELFKNGPEGIKGNPILMSNFIEIEREHEMSNKLEGLTR